MDLHSSSLVGPFPSSWCRRVSKVYTALSICCKADSRARETLQSPFPRHGPVSPHTAATEQSGMVCGLHARWVSRCRCLRKCVEIPGRDQAVGVDPKEV